MKINNEIEVQLRPRHSIDYDALLRGEYTQEEEDALIQREDFETITAEAEILSLIRHSKAIEFTEDDKGRFIIASPSLRHDGWQITYFDKLGPIRHSSAHDPVDVAKELAERFSNRAPVKVSIVDYERSEPQMQFVNSFYVSPNGSKMEDGLNPIGDHWTLKYAEAALMQAGFVHVYGEATERTVVVNSDRFLTQGQINTLQDTILESLKAGADVTIETLDKKSTSLVDENTWKIAQITGYLVNNGDFAYGDYASEREKAERTELEASLRRSDALAYER